MNILDIKNYKRFVENGEYNNSLVEKLSDRYSQQEQESISHYDILINSSRANTIYKDRIAYKCIVDYGKLPSKSSLSNNQLMFHRQVITRHSDGIKAGDVVEFAHNPYNDRKTYILLKTIETRDGYDLSIMQDCVSAIKWLDSRGTLQEAWFVIKNNFFTNTGIEDGQVINSGNERRQIVIQNNESTQSITKDKRFIFDNRAWRTISVDGSIEGLIILVLEESHMDISRDNLELKIADYYNNIHNTTISILNGELVKINKGNSIQLDVIVADNGKEIDTPLRYQSLNDSIAHVDQNGILRGLSAGQTTVTVSLKNDETIKASINVTVSAAVPDSFSITITGSDFCKVGTSQSYSAEIRNNGIAETRKYATFTLFSDDQSSATTLASIVNQDGINCTLKGNGNQKYGYVQLKAEMSDDSSVASFKRIHIKSLI